MKLKELKHNHSLTDLLKGIIFSILMLAPILSIATRCMYVICNKNAYQSYYGETINEVQYKEDNVLKVGNEYQMSFNNYTSLISTSQSFSLSNITNLTCNDTNTLNNINAILDDVNTIVLANNGTTNMYVSFREDNTTLLNVGVHNKILDFNFISNSNIELIQQTKDFIYSITYNKDSYLDNVFEYSVNELENSQLFNWTENTAIYTGVKTMTTGLEITGNVIPMLITYWLLLIIVYIILDIVIVLFTKSTHLLGNKTT